MSRRADLEQLTSRQAEHAGLWLDKYITSQRREDVGAKQTVVNETARIAVPAEYKRFFQRYQSSLSSMDTLIHYGRVRGRLVVGLGSEGVLETAVTLHHTYGVPYIPGSALKGLAASYARNHLLGTWSRPEQPSDPHALTAYEFIFGNTSSAGYVTFFDALYVPPDYNQQVYPLAPDVLTVHHRDYYGSSTQVNAAPADWDSPIPVPFASTTGTYLIALGGDKRWIAQVMRILVMALREAGIGAKTSSGYGRMAVYSILPSEKPGPALGDTFSGAIIDADDEIVLIKVDGFSQDEIGAVLRRDATTPHWRVGRDRSSFEVVGMRRVKGRIILEVHRAVKVEQ
jgi:CRISPR-associated protein Cmr6